MPPIARLPERPQVRCWEGCSAELPAPMSLRVLRWGHWRAARSERPSIPNMSSAATRAASGLSIALDRGCVDLVGADAFARLLPEIAIPSLPFPGAYGIRVASLLRTDDLLARAGLPTRWNEQELVAAFPAELGRGAWLFTE